MGKSVGYIGDGAVENCGVMLAHIGICTGLLVLPLHSLIAGVRHVFLVFTPADAFLLEEVDDSGDVARIIPAGVIAAMLLVVNTMEIDSAEYSKSGVTF